MAKMDEFSLTMDIRQKEGTEVFETLVETFVADLQTKGFDKVAFVIQGKMKYKEPEEE